jgi:hypothetical protein
VCAANALRSFSSAVKSSAFASSSSIGYAEGEFQYLSNEAEASRTTGPTIAKSRSTKFTSSLAPKYSSPTLRPPTIANRLSAIQLLLCMRRLMRPKLAIPSLMKARVPLREANGLNMRMSILGCAARAA